jgi:hypothetical protein
LRVRHEQRQRRLAESVDGAEDGVDLIRAPERIE